MTDILAEFFDQFNPEEQAFIRAKETEAKIILLQGQSDIAERFRIGYDRESVLQPQDDARAQAAATEFVGYQRVLVRRIDPVCTESVQQYLGQLDRICEGVLLKYGTWEGKDAIAELRAEAERLAWLSLAKQLDSATASKIAAAQPEHRKPSATSWDAVEISFLSDERVQCRNDDNTETCNYRELGFADTRTGKPNLAWIMLRVLAESGGTIRDVEKTGGNWSTVEKRIQEIRKTLRQRFGISEDPVPHVKRIGYQARFKIGCNPSFRT
jgi:hypothetical protein